MIAKQVVDLIQEYSIKKKLGYFILDNDTSNDTCVKAVLKAIWLDFSKKKQRLQCIRHNINLAAQSFLYDKNEEVCNVEVQSTCFLANIKK